MAIYANTTKTLKSSNNYSYTLYGSFTEKSTSTSNNTSTIEGYGKIECINSYWTTTYPSTLEIYWYDNNANQNGKLIASTSFKGMSSQTDVKSCSGTITVTHKSDGTLSGYLKVIFTKGSTTSAYAPASGNSSTDWTALTNIPRYATSNQSLNSKTSSSIKMNWSSDSTIDYIWYSTNNGSSWTGVGSVNATSGSYTISGLAANTTYNIKTRVRRKDSQLTTDSSNLAVATYARTTPTISLSSKTVNSITVTSGCNVTVSSTKYRIKTSSGSYGSYQDSATFTGLTPNTAYVIEVYKVGSASGESGTATLNVTTYQIATINASNFIHGDNLPVTINNPSGAQVAVAVYTSDIQTALASYRNISGTSYTFNFTDAELDNIYKKYGNNSTLNVKVYVTMIVNNVSYWDYKEVTVTLKGNQKTQHIKVNGSWKRAYRWIKVNGSWKRAVRWIKVNGVWKRTI